MPSESTNVFVSYSHVDALLVSPVVKLLRVNKSLIFQDIDSIQPGKRWQGQIAKALAESHLVVVFWCTHARQSNEVSKEWQAAIEQKKDLLPLLLDGTPLPPALAEFQWIDFRGTVGAYHGLIDSVVGADALSGPPRMMSVRRSARRLLLTACAAVFGVAAVLAWLYAFGLRSLLLLGIVFAVTAWLLGRYPKQQIDYLSVRPSGDIERHIASEVEAEILRRATLRRGEGR